MAISAETIRQLHPYETRILHTLERLMGSHSWAPLDLIRKRAGFSESEARFRLGSLMEKGMVRYDVVPYEGYSLTFLGSDTLALLSLSRRGSLSALGPLIGEGKESVVYEGMGLGRVAIKCHHVGQRSFQSVRVSRGTSQIKHTAPGSLRRGLLPRRSTRRSGGCTPEPGSRSLSTGDATLS